MIHAEDSIIVATRCENIPVLYTPSTSSGYNSMDITGPPLSMAMHHDAVSDLSRAPNESCKEESAISLCEVKLVFDGFRISM